MTFRLRDDDQWLIVCRVADEHRFVKSQPNSVVTAWAAEEVTTQLRVGCAGNLFEAHRAGGDIAEVAVGANRWEHGTGDVSAVQILFADRVMGLRQFNAVGRMVIRIRMV
jgi:hypothetical protein